jgi:protein-ribulosamine 3-kinase
MVEGEFASMRLIHQLVPSFAPKPLSWGTCVDHPDRHFILFSFHDLKEGLLPPPPDRVAFAAAQLHQLSLALTIPRLGKFGFHIATYNGTLKQDNTWTDTWEDFYTRGMVRMLELEEEAGGPCQELRDISKPFLERVIPRLLRPLETGGRSIQPVLVHGDLWIGNVSTRVSTGEPMMFDASAFWGHNECPFSFLFFFS